MSSTSSGSGVSLGHDDALGHAQQHQARGVEQLVGQLAALADALLVEAHVLRRGHRQQAVADRVGAVGGEVAALGEDRRARPAVDQRHRVDPGTERLRHPAPVRGLDDRVHVDVVERDVARELESHEDHTGDPQEEDVARGREDVGGIERAQLRRVVRPAERRERPQRAREPRVQHVRVALPAGAVRRVHADVGLVAAVIDGQPVSPPELARDAPRPDVLQPVQVAAPLALGVDPDPALGDRGVRRRGQLLHLHEPLERDQRLDPLARALRERAPRACTARCG